MPGAGRKIVQSIEKGVTATVLASKVFWREVVEAIDETPKAIDRFSNALEEVIKHADKGTVEVCKTCYGEGYDLDGLGVHPCPDCTEPAVCKTCDGARYVEKGFKIGRCPDCATHYWTKAASKQWHCCRRGSGETLCGHPWAECVDHRFEEPQEDVCETCSKKVMGDVCETCSKKVMGLDL